MSMAQSIATGRTAAQVLEYLDGLDVDLDQDWVEGTTTARFDDGSVLVIDGPTVTVL